MHLIPGTFRIFYHAAILWLCLLHADEASAWGNLGHRVTGLIAAQLLTPAAHYQVAQLLGDESLADAALYMDTHRDELHARWPDSARWHYDNERVCNNTPYCLDGECATAQIEHFRQVLANGSNSRQERALALRLLIHMLGDIHQPLHMADNHDHGGNDVWVRLSADGTPHRLHEVFDTELVKEVMAHQRDYDYAHALITRYNLQLDHWRQGSPTSWASESYQLAVTEVYGRLPYFACNSSNDRVITLPADYLRRARDYVPLQLARAGTRIAAVLNATLH